MKSLWNSVRWLIPIAGICLPLACLWAGVVPSGEINSQCFALIAAGSLGTLVVVVVFAVELYRRIDCWLNQPPPESHFAYSQRNLPYLFVDVDGSYKGCQLFVRTLATEFGAEVSEHLRRGDHSYWNSTMFGQKFFVMGVRGGGIFISQESSADSRPTDFHGFMRVAMYFQAREHLTWQQKLARLLGRKHAITNASPTPHPHSASGR